MIRIELDTTKEGHEDLTLFLDEISFSTEADSYYLMLDNKILPNEESYQKVKIVLDEMLQSWIAQVKQLNAHDIVFLPFDFSDQYIGCIRVEAIDDKNVSINYGFTTVIHGYSIAPSLGSIDIGDEAYEVDSNSFIVTKEELLHSIQW
jgi:hypothetical protein